MKMFENMDVSTLEAVMCVAVVVAVIGFCAFLYFCYQEYKWDLRLKAMDRRAERFERRMTHAAIRGAAWEEIKAAVRK